MSGKKLFSVFIKTGLMQLGLLLLFQVFIIAYRGSSLEGNQGATIITLFSFFLSSILNITGVGIGYFFLKLINENLSFYSLIVVCPLLIFSLLLFLTNKLDQQFYIFLVPAFCTFIFSHVIMFVSLQKQRYEQK